MKTLDKVKLALQRKEEYESQQSQINSQMSDNQSYTNEQQLEDGGDSQAEDSLESKMFEFSPDEIGSIQAALKEEIQHWQFEFLPEHSNSVQVYRIKTNQNLSLELLELSEGLATKEVEVVEINESGSVNELRVRNLSLKHLLIYEGSLLQGEKQNRIVNATLLLKPESETIIPVSCVERGRWNKQSSGFSKPNYDATSSMRHRLKKDIMAYKMAHKSDQSNIWREVSRFSAMEDANNETSDFADSYEKAKKERYTFKEGLKFNSNGILARAGKADYTDFVRDEKAFTSILERISKGYEFEKEDTAKADKTPDAYLLEIVENAVKDVYVQASIGLGHDLRLETESHFINTLLVEDEFVAVSIARKPEFDYFD